MSRTCGSCRMCCKHMYVAERGTLEGTRYEFKHYPGNWCEFACAKGCELHDTPYKPIACRTYACLWLMGFGDEDDRPDKIKLIGSVEPRAPIGYPAETYIVLYNCVPDAWSSDRARHFMHVIDQLLQVSGAAVEIVPADPTATVRMGWHKDHGKLEIHIPPGKWPEPLDADQERADIASLFGGVIPENVDVALLSDMLNHVPDEQRRAFTTRLWRRMGKT